MLAFLLTRHTMLIAQTNRLKIRQIVSKDAQFLLKLYNQPAFLKNIGDRGVNSLNQAARFIETTQKHYQEDGFWLYLLEEISTGIPIGINGLIQRDYLNAPDIGFAIDEQHWRKGYAYESSQAIIQHAQSLGYKEIVAITNPENQNSIQLLLKLGFDFSKCDDFEGNGEAINLYKISILGKNS